MNNTTKFEGFTVYPDGSAANAIATYRGFRFACKTVGGHVRLYRLDAGSGRVSNRDLIVATKVITKAYTEARDALVSAEWMDLNRAMYPEAV